MNFSAESAKTLYRTAPSTVTEIKMSLKKFRAKTKGVYIRLKSVRLSKNPVDYGDFVKVLHSKRGLEVDSNIRELFNEMEMEQFIDFAKS